MSENSNIDPNTQGRRKKHLLLLVFMITASFFIFSEYGLLKRITVQSELGDVEQKLEEALLRKDSLKLEIESMETDINEIERVAREDYGMIKPGEVVYILDSSATKEKIEE